MQHSPFASSSTTSAERTSCPASVKIIETDASIRCGLKTNTIYELSVGPYRIELQQDHKVLFDWPINYIRRFGYTTQSFSFEVGSKASSGEGLFIFKTKKSRIIYDQILANVDWIKRQKLTTTPEAILTDRQCSSMPEYAQIIKSQRHWFVSIYLLIKSCNSQNCLYNISIEINKQSFRVVKLLSNNFVLSTCV